MVEIGEPAAVARCANCQAQLAGRYCAACGEKVMDARALTVRHFIVDTLGHELAHLDGKFWRTLRHLMLRPGFLTAEYCAGRRVRYINPMRLLIAAIVTYALLARGGLNVAMRVGWVVLSIAPATISEQVSVPQTVRQIDRFGLLTTALEDKQRAGDTESEAARVRFHTELRHFAEPLSFTNAVLLAVALYALFHRRRRLFVAHAVFAVHVVSFTLLSSSALALASRQARAQLTVMLTVLFVVTIWQFWYLTVAMRRFYFADVRRRARAWLYGGASAVLVYVLNSAFMTAVQIAGAAVALRSL